MEERKVYESVKQEKPRNRYKEVIITPGVCGFRVKIGCSEAYFGQTEVAVLKSAISRWLDDPATVEMEYLRMDNRDGSLVQPTIADRFPETNPGCGAAIGS